jgi:hypothetical protein
MCLYELEPYLPHFMASIYVCGINEYILLRFYYKLCNTSNYIVLKNIFLLKII